MPKRIQLKRQKGWRKPEGAVVVARPSRWGNPYRIGHDELTGHVWTVEETITAFRQYAEQRLEREPGWLEPLRGKDLCCWCRLDQPCHADVLLELAARDEPA